MNITKTVKLKENGELVEKTLLFKEVSYNVAKEMIVKNHYSHKWNTAFGKINIGVFFDGELMGCAVFGNLMNPKSFLSISKQLTQDAVIELNRLWVDDRLGGNAETTMLSACWKIMKSDYPHIKVIQSFADGRLGVGTIYKAASFKYYGVSSSLFYEHTDTKVVYHKVPMENTKRPDGMIKLNTAMVKGLLRPFEVHTYRYLYILDKNIEVDLQELPYPTYTKDTTDTVKYTHNIKLVYRAFILSCLLGYEERYDIFNFLSNYDLEDILNEFENKSIKLIAEERGLKDLLNELYTNLVIDGLVNDILDITKNSNPVNDESSYEEE